MNNCGRGDLFLVFTCFGAENGDPVVNRGPQFFFFLFMNLNLTHHLKRFAVPALNHKSTYYKRLKANIHISQFLIIVLKTSVLARNQRVGQRVRQLEKVRRPCPEP